MMFDVTQEQFQVDQRGSLEDDIEQPGTPLSSRTPVLNIEMDSLNIGCTILFVEADAILIQDPALPLTFCVSKRIQGSRSSFWETIDHCYHILNSWFYQRHGS